MQAMLRIAFKTTILAVLAMVSQASRAEYYLEYPEPRITQVIEYTSPHYHGKMKKHHLHHVRHHVRHQARRSHYSITVTYYWPICPGCACRPDAPYCYPNDEQMNTKAVTGSYVTFSYEAKNFSKLKTPKSDNETYDMRTADDDVMRYPDMNNQYNQF